MACPVLDLPLSWPILRNSNPSFLFASSTRRLELAGGGRGGVEELGWRLWPVLMIWTDVGGSPSCQRCPFEGSDWLVERVSACPCGWRKQGRFRAKCAELNPFHFARLWRMVMEPHDGVVTYPVPKGDVHTVEDISSGPGWL